MKIIRKQLARTNLLPASIRYDDATDTVQTFDGTDWVDTPESDPRHTNHFPPPDTANPRCDAAARMTAYVEEMITAVEEGLGISEAVGLILSVITAGFALFGGVVALLLFLFEALATALIDAGVDDLEANFDATFYENLVCYFYGAMSSDGRLTAAGLAQVRTDITANESATINDVMQVFFNLTGEGLLNDIASVREEEGDCSECPDTWTITLTPDNVADLQTSFWGGNTLNCSNGLSYQGQRGEVRAESGVNVWDWTLLYGTRGVQVSVRLPLPVGTDLRTLLIAYTRQSGSQCLVTLNIPAGRVYCFVNPNGESVGIPDTLMITGDGLIHELVVTANNNSASHVVYIRQIILGGQGPSPVFQET